MSGKREGTTRLRDIARENLAEPPPRDRIEALPPLGDGSFAFDLSGLAFAFDGLNADLLEGARRRFGAYLCDPSSAPAPLRVSIHADEIEYYVRPERPRPEGYYRLRIVNERETVRLVTYGMAAWIDLEASRAGAAFGTGNFDPRERALENFCRVAVAFMALRRGGLFLHGAGIERGGRAYVFFGRSASGKSTLAKMNTEGRVVSDDLTLIVPGPGGALCVAGSPFRGTYEGGEAVKGLYPLAGIFRLVQDTRTFVEKRPRVQSMAELVANLPFVNESLNLRPELFDALDRALAPVPLRFLHFRMEPDFWAAVDGALGGA
jgi:hypothetical protein